MARKTRSSGTATIHPPLKQPLVRKRRVIVLECDYCDTRPGCACGPNIGCNAGSKTVGASYKPPQPLFKIVGETGEAFKFGCSMKKEDCNHYRRCIKCNEICLLQNGEFYCNGCSGTCSVCERPSGDTTDMCDECFFNFVTDAELPTVFTCYICMKKKMVGHETEEGKICALCFMDLPNKSL